MSCLAWSRTRNSTNKNIYCGCSCFTPILRRLIASEWRIDEECSTLQDFASTSVDSKRWRSFFSVFPITLNSRSKAVQVHTQFVSFFLYASTGRSQSRYIKHTERRYYLVIVRCLVFVYKMFYFWHHIHDDDESVRSSFSVQLLPL